MSAPVNATLATLIALVVLLNWNHTLPTSLAHDARATLFQIYILALGRSHQRERSTTKCAQDLHGTAR